MSQPLDIARQTLLDLPGLQEHDLARVMDRLLAADVDAADVYFQHSRLESWVLEDGLIKEGNHTIEQGAGLRAVSGEKTGFAYTDDLRLEDLLEAAGAARAIARGGRQGRLQVRAAAPAKPLYPAINPLDSLDADAKIGLLKRLDAEARAQDPRVQQVVCSIVAAHDVVLVAASDGSLAGDVRPLVRVNVQVIA
ncbi:MAG: DNA gyrase modulator, partial [Gammaproteobacteria bacterium]